MSNTYKPTYTPQHNSDDESVLGIGSGVRFKIDEFNLLEPCSSSSSKMANLLEKCGSKSISEDYHESSCKAHESQNISSNLQPDCQPIHHLVKLRNKGRKKKSKALETDDSSELNIVDKVNKGKSKCSIVTEKGHKQSKRKGKERIKVIHKLKKKSKTKLKINKSYVNSIDDAGVKSQVPYSDFTPLEIDSSPENENLSFSYQESDSDCEKKTSEIKVKDAIKKQVEKSRRKRTEMLLNYSLGSSNSCVSSKDSNDEIQDSLNDFNNSKNEIDKADVSKDDLFQNIDYSEMNTSPSDVKRGDNKYD